MKNRALYDLHGHRNEFAACGMLLLCSELQENFTGYICFPR